jgi:hypothetical protein
MMDTYERALGIMAQTPVVLDALFAIAPATALRERPAPEEWSPYEVLAHMRSVNGLISQRIVLMLEHDNPEFPRPEPPAPLDDMAALLADWRATRAQHLAWLRGLSPQQLARTGRSTRFGQMTAREHIIEWAYHDLDHTRQILAALQGMLYDDIPAFHPLYPRPV